MKHKGSKWAKQVDWVGQLTNPIAKCCKLPSTIPNPKGQVMSTCGQWQGRSCQVQGSRKFSQPNSRQGSGRGLSPETQKKTVISLLRPLAQWRMYTALCKFASSSFLIFYLSSPWVIATMKIVNMEQWKFYHLLLLPGTSAHIIFGQTP